MGEDEECLPGCFLEDHHTTRSRIPADGERERWEADRIWERRDGRMDAKRQVELCEEGGTT